MIEQETKEIFSGNVSLQICKDLMRYEKQHNVIVTGIQETEPGKYVVTFTKK